MGIRTCHKRVERFPQRIQNTLRSFHCYAVVLVALIPRNLRLGHAEAFGQLALRQAVRDPQSNQQAAYLSQVPQRRDFTAAYPFIPIHLLCKLGVVGK